MKAETFNSKITERILWSRVAIWETKQRADHTDTLHSYTSIEMAICARRPQILLRQTVIEFSHLALEMHSSEQWLTRESLDPREAAVRMQNPYSEFLINDFIVKLCL